MTQSKTELRSVLKEIWKSKNPFHNKLWLSTRTIVTTSLVSVFRIPFGLLGALISKLGRLLSMFVVCSITTIVPIFLSSLRSDVLATIAVITGMWLWGSCVFFISLYVFDLRLPNHKSLQSIISRTAHSSSLWGKLTPILFCYFIIISCFAAWYTVLHTSSNVHFGQSNFSPNYPFLDFHYFGIITTMTVGYGDIYPKSDWARILVELQALHGILLLVISLTHAIGIHKKTE